MEATNLKPNNDVNNFIRGESHVLQKLGFIYREGIKIQKAKTKKKFLFLFCAIWLTSYLFNYQSNFIDLLLLAMLYFWYEPVILENIYYHMLPRMIPDLHSTIFEHKCHRRQYLGQYAEWLPNWPMLDNFLLKSISEITKEHAWFNPDPNIFGNDIKFYIETYIAPEYDTFEIEITVFADVEFEQFSSGRYSGNIWEYQGPISNLNLPKFNSEIKRRSKIKRHQAMPSK